MSFDILAKLNGTQSNLKNIHNVRAVVTKEINFEDWLAPSEFVASGALTYTIQNGQSSTAAPRNNQAEWKFTRGSSSSATSAAATGTYVEVFNSNAQAYRFFQNGSGGYGDMQNITVHRNKIFVSKGSSTAFDNNLSAMASATYKGQGEIVSINCPVRYTDGLGGSNITLEKQLGVVYEGHITAAGVISRSGYWELNVSVRGADGGGVMGLISSGMSSTNNYNTNSNTRNGLCRVDLANAPTPAPSSYANDLYISHYWQPQGQTWITVSKKDTYYRAKPTALTQTQFENNYPSLTIPYPNGYSQSDITVLLDLEGTGGRTGYGFSFIGDDYGRDERENFMYAIISEPILNATKNSTGVAVTPPSFYGADGIYPADRVTDGTTSTYHADQATDTDLMGQSSFYTSHFFNDYSPNANTSADATVTWDGDSYYLPPNPVVLFGAISTTSGGSSAINGKVSECLPLKGRVYLVAES